MGLPEENLKRPIEGLVSLTQCPKGSDIGQIEYKSTSCQAKLLKNASFFASLKGPVYYIL